MSINKTFTDLPQNLVNICASYISPPELDFMVSEPLPTEARTREIFQKFAASYESTETWDWQWGIDVSSKEEREAMRRGTGRAAITAHFTGLNRNILKILAIPQFVGNPRCPSILEGDPVLVSLAPQYLSESFTASGELQITDGPNTYSCRVPPPLNAPRAVSHFRAHAIIQGKLIDIAIRTQSWEIFTAVIERSTNANFIFDTGYSPVCAIGADGSEVLSEVFYGRTFSSITLSEEENAPKLPPTASNYSRFVRESDFYESFVAVRDGLNEVFRTDTAPSLENLKKCVRYVVTYSLDQVGSLLQVDQGTAAEVCNGAAVEAATKQKEGLEGSFKRKINKEHLLHGFQFVLKGAMSSATDGDARDCILQELEIISKFHPIPDSLLLATILEEELVRRKLSSLEILEGSFNRLVNSLKKPAPSDASTATAIVAPSEGDVERALTAFQGHFKNLMAPPSALPDASLKKFLLEGLKTVLGLPSGKSVQTLVAFFKEELGKRNWLPTN